MTRQIVHFQIAYATEMSAHKHDVVLALCDDGSLWWSNISNNTENWQKYADIPQPEEVKLTPNPLNG